MVHTACLAWHIEAQAWPTPPVPAGASFDDAVASAKLLAAQPIDDGIHRPHVNPTQGLLQSLDGSFSIVPLGGAHRDQTGPLFIDGQFFESTALTLQITRRVPQLVAVVGASRVVDLRHTGAGFVQSDNDNPPIRPRTVPVTDRPAQP